MLSTQTPYFLYTLLYTFKPIKMEKINRECKNEKHIRRDNNIGVTWCIRCGRLFNKPCGKDLTKEDKVRFNCL